MLLTISLKTKYRDSRGKQDSRLKGTFPLVLTKINYNGERIYVGLKVEVSHFLFNYFIILFEVFESVFPRLSSVVL